MHFNFSHAGSVMFHDKFVNCLFIQLMSSLNKGHPSCKQGLGRGREGGREGGSMHIIVLLKINLDSVYRISKF